MAEPFQTLREVGVAIEGIKDQLGTYAKVFGAVVVLGLTVIGFLYSKIDSIEEGVARNTAILERIEAQLNTMATDTAAIKDTVQTASAKPSPGSFQGYVGVKAPQADFKKLSGDENYRLIFETMGAPDEGWIYFPQE